MKGENKYGNKPFWYDYATGRSYTNKKNAPESSHSRLQHWDSILEFHTYSQLSTISNCTKTDRQVQLSVMSKTPVFPKVTWSIDFVVETKKKVYYVETKGRWILHDTQAMSNFHKLLMLVNLQRPVIFSNLIIASDIRWKLGSMNFWTTPIEQLKDVLE